jgi:erythronate-4-phosphate dehydrogenase
MILAVDDAVPYAKEAFGRVGEVRLVPGRAMSSADLRDADALVVRSVTKVDKKLLEGSPVQFVGTATIGTDHLDLAYLESRGIHVANAAGCNANAVTEYVLTALLVIAERKRWNLSDKSIGIIGVGHIGSRLAKKAAALGMKVRLCDPPLRESTGDSRFGNLEDVLGADILTLHVPLTHEGPYPTRHMIRREVLQRLSPEQLVINTSRGPVVSGPDLKRALLDGRIAGAVLDVWEGEPFLDCDLLDRVDIATPHIAGYSLDGKVRATSMIFEEICRHFKIASTWDASGIFPLPQRLQPSAGADPMDGLRSAALQAYNIHKDDRALRSTKDLSRDAAGEFFERLRVNYPFRLEFSHFIVAASENPAAAPILASMGFEIESALSSKEPPHVQEGRP